MEKEYKTSDLALAAVISLWVSIDRLEKVDTRKVNFVFPNTEQLQKIVDGFWKKKLQVEPQDYFAAMKQLKNMIFDSERR